MAKILGIPRVATSVGIFEAFPREILPECISQKNILKINVNTTLFPKLDALRLGLNIDATGNKENIIQIRAREIFS